MPNVDPAAWANLNAQDGLPEAVWFLPRTAKREFACLLVERVGGPKTYQRHWENGESDWGWVDPGDDAVLLWRAEPDEGA
jgi:hypothetical protein